MSEPTYRIETSHDPQEHGKQWKARVHRVSDGEHLGTGWGYDEEEALDEAQNMVGKEAGRESGHTVYMDEDGEVCDPPEPQSLRVAP